MIRSQKKLGEILLSKGLITEEQLTIALAEQVSTKEYLGKILIKNHFIDERGLMEALSEQFQIPILSFKDRYIEWEFVMGFSASLILDYRCFPVQRGEYTVTMAIINPLDVWVLEKAQEEARGWQLSFVLISERDMEEAIDRYRQYVKGYISRR